MGTDDDLRELFVATDGGVPPRVVRGVLGGSSSSEETPSVLRGLRPFDFCFGGYLCGLREGVLLWVVRDALNTLSSSEESPSDPDPSCEGSYRTVKVVALSFKGRCLHVEYRVGRVFACLWMETMSYQ